uniref:Uncharacterized protein n=1 Tax=Anguilla anguilla TaxID=7936 RepID=A0A0E9THE7_ANGAN
MIVRMTTP